MYLVGDAVTHAAFLSALGHGHGYIGRVDVWYAGQKIGELGFERELSDGRIQVTGRNRERRTLELTARESLWPVLPTDLLSPYGVWLQAWVTVTAGVTRFPPVPVFAGKVLTVKRQRWSGEISVSANDPMWQINREAFELPRPAPLVSVVSALQALITEVFPSATLLDQSGSTATIPEGVVWNHGAASRGKVFDDLSASIGAELYARPTVVSPGGDFVLRPVPALISGSADWVIPDGMASVVEGDELSQSGAKVVNRWVVTAEQQNAPSVYVTVTDTDPGSPTRYGGPMGKLVEFYSSPLITTAVQAQAAGQAKLNRSKGLARQRRLTVIANPAIEAGDILAVSVNGEPVEYHIADDIELSLTPEQPSMTIDTRVTGGSS